MVSQPEPEVMIAVNLRKSTLKSYNLKIDNVRLVEPIQIFI